MEEPAKILVVDDDTASLVVINGILSGKYKVYPVNSGEAALSFLCKKRPDLILLDMEMPGMNGKELFGRLKAEQALSGVPVIFLTGNGDTQDEAAAFKLGISDYIRKPVSETVLNARVSLHLELAALRARAHLQGGINPV